jgi:hypothetical protein
VKSPNSSAAAAYVAQWAALREWEANALRATGVETRVRQLCAIFDAWEPASEAELRERERQREVLAARWLRIRAALTPDA